MGGHVVSFLEREKDGYVLSLTMNSPDTRNALTGDEQFEDFVAVCKEINDDKISRFLTNFPLYINSNSKRFIFSNNCRILVI